MLREFREFVMRGNVVDLAVAVIIGAAFGQVVNSFVNDILSPILGLLGGLPDFSAWKLGPVGIGGFLNTIVNFLVIAAVIFFVVVKPMQHIQKMAAQKKAAEVEPAPPAESEETKILKDILEELRKRNA
ncbi:large conductance mechanosensitive channel protein MscL [Coprothermobacteraceae bacterium]|nr:large conductance mechanosensitive channel protein MscL [Coprothermobacteraceae bacterium]